MRFWALGFGLPHTQARPDEIFIIDVALRYLRGDFWAPFYDYPRLFCYLVTAGYLAYFWYGRMLGRFLTLYGFVARFPVHWEPFFLIGRAISASAGVLTILVVYRIGRRLGDASVGLLGAFFLSLSFLHVRDSHYGTTDATMTLFIMLATMWLLQSNLQRAGWTDVWAATAAGLATGTKYGAALMAVPLGIGQLYRAWSQPGRRLAALFDSRAVLMIGAFAAAFLLSAPFVVFDYARFSTAFTVLWRSTSRGGSAAGNLHSFWYHLTFSLRYGVGVPLLVLGLAGIAWTAARDWRRALLLYSFPVAFYALIASMGDRFVRYAIPIVPFLCLSAAVLIDDLSRLVGRGPRVRAAVAGALAIATIAPSARSVLAFDRILARTDNRVLAAQWFNSHAAPGASVLTSGSPYGYPQFDDELFRIWNWDRQREIFMLDGAPARGRPEWILVQESPLPSETQGEVKAFLSDGYELVTVFKAFDPNKSGNLYDRQDAFFVPIAGFTKITRPGPNFYVYKHADAAIAHRAGPG